MADLYLGRIVAVARNREGRCAALYRVSSRSFPNRCAQRTDCGVAIVPKEGHEGDVFKNPYIAYNCCRIVGETAVLTNGAQTDFIAERIEAGLPVREALALTMLAMDYEHDKLDTPRVAAVVRRGAEAGYLAVVRKDGLEVRRVELDPGACVWVATYEHDSVDPGRRDAFAATSPEAACDYVLGEGAFAQFRNPITAVCALAADTGFALAARDAK